MQAWSENINTNLQDAPDALTFIFFATTALASFSSWVAVAMNWQLSIEPALFMRSEHLRLTRASPDTTTFTFFLALVSISCPYSLYRSDISFTFSFFSSSLYLTVSSSRRRMMSASLKACSTSVWIVTCGCILLVFFLLTRSKRYQRALPDGACWVPGPQSPFSALAVPPRSPPRPEGGGRLQKRRGAPQARADWGSGCGMSGWEHWEDKSVSWHAFTCGTFQINPPGDPYVDGSNKADALPLFLHKVQLGLQILRCNSQHHLCGHVWCDAVVVLQDG